MYELSKNFFFSPSLSFFDSTRSYCINTNMPTLQRLADGSQFFLRRTTMSEKSQVVLRKGSHCERRLETQMEETA